jgi:hypothetical protein
MGGMFLPFPQQKQDPWALFFQAFTAGQQLRQERERYEQAFQSEAEDRKLRQQQLKLQMDALKLEGATREKQAQLDLAQIMQNVPGQMFGVQAQQEVPGMALDLEGGMAPSTFAPGPVQNVEIPFHNVPGPLGNLQVPSRGETQRAGLEQLLSKLMLEAQGAGMKVGAEQQAKAPYEAAAREDTQGFTAEQNRLDRETRVSEGSLNRNATLEAARISQAGQTVSVSTRDSQGNPITVVLPKKDVVGKQFPAQLSAGAEAQLREADATLSGLAAIEGSLKDAYVGPVAGRAYSASESLPLGAGQFGGILGLPNVTPERSEFGATVAAINNRAINVLSGANVPPKEYERVRKQLPLVTDPPAVFRSKVIATRKNMERIKAVILSGGGGTPAASSGTPQLPPMSVGTVVEGPDGRRYTMTPNGWQ